MSERPMTWAWDIDDTLINSWRGAFDVHNLRYGTNLTEAHWYNKEPEHIRAWGEDITSYELSVVRINEILDSEEFVKAAVAIPGMPEILRDAYDRGDEQQAVTSRPTWMRKNTLAVLNITYNPIFTEENVHFMDHDGPAHLRRRKGAVMKALGADAAYEDFVENANDIAAEGIPVGLTSEGWWNKDKELHPLVTRTPDAAAVLEHMDHVRQRSA